jgi:hypothetical protein
MSIFEGRRCSVGLDLIARLNSCHAALALRFRAGRGPSYDGILITLCLVMGVVALFCTFPVLPALSGLLELLCDVLWKFIAVSMI